MTMEENRNGKTYINKTKKQWNLGKKKNIKTRKEKKYSYRLLICTLPRFL